MSIRNRQSEIHNRLCEFGGAVQGDVVDGVLEPDRAREGSGLLRVRDGVPLAGEELLGLLVAWRRLNRRT